MRDVESPRLAEQIGQSARLSGMKTGTSRTDAPAIRSWGSDAGASRVRLAGAFLGGLVLLPFLLAGCAPGAGGAPSASVATAPAATVPTTSAPATSPPAAEVVPPIETPAEAVAAVVAADPSFRGIRARDPMLIGQSAWVETRPTSTGYEITFFRGSGDCPAGCIERTYVRFSVSRAGSVEKRCEWKEGEGARGTPC